MPASITWRTPVTAAVLAVLAAPVRPRTTAIPVRVDMDTILEAALAPHVLRASGRIQLLLAEHALLLVQPVQVQQLPAQAAHQTTSTTQVAILVLHAQVVKCGVLPTEALVHPVQPTVPLAPAQPVSPVALAMLSKVPHVWPAPPASTPLALLATLAPRIASLAVVVLLSAPAAAPKKDWMAAAFAPHALATSTRWVPPNHVERALPTVPLVPTATPPVVPHAAVPTDSLQVLAPPSARRVSTGLRLRAARV